MNTRKWSRGLVLFVPTMTLARQFCSGSAAAPMLIIPTSENVGANMATLVLQSDSTGTSYFTLLSLLHLEQP